MIKILRQLFSFVTIPKSKIFIVIMINILEAVFAVSSIALLYPVIEYFYLGKNDFISSLDSGYMSYLKSFFDLIQVKITIYVLIFCSVVPVMLQSVITFIRSRYVIVLQQKVIVLNMREKILKTLLNADIAYFDSLRLGEAANVVVLFTTYSGLILQYIIDVVSRMLIGAIYVVLLVYIAPILALLALLLMAIIPYISHKHAKSIKDTSGIIAKCNADLSSFVVEKLKNIKSIVLHNTQEPEISFFKDIAASLERAITRSHVTIEFIRNLMQPFFSIAALVIILVSLKYLHISMSIVVLFVVILAKLAMQINIAIKSRNQVFIYAKSFQKLISYYESAKHNVTIKNGTKKFVKLEKEIKLDNIFFSYNKNQPLFNGFSAFVKANETLALVGRSGSGKSTLIDLLLRLRDIRKGNILLDGVNIKDIDLRSYYSNIGYMQQSNFSFFGTVRENILYGINGKSDDDIMRACARVGADDFIDRLEHGLDSDMGEAGAKFSEGEKQRLGLAHIILKDPDIVILDEPTSSLDPVSEKIIKDTIDSFKGKKTVIIIAHRLSTIKDADNIIVLDNGILAEEGDYGGLLSQKGLFAKFVDMQTI